MRIRGLVVALGAAVALAGCTGVAGDPKDPVAVWAEHQAEFLAQYGEMPEGDPAYTEEEAHAALAVNAEAWWVDAVLSLYPNAVRPTDGFVRWAERDDPLSLDSDYAKCLQAHGVTPTLGYTADGSVGGMDTSANSEEGLLGNYFCAWVAYPRRPAPPPNAARLGYVWDYNAEFLVPCFEDNDVPQTPMVSRDEWIASSPKFEWSLQHPNDDSELDRLYEICPSDPIH